MSVSNLRCGEFKFDFTGVKPKVTRYRGKVSNTVKNFALMRVCKDYAGYVAACQRRGQSRAHAWGMVDWAARRGLLRTPGNEAWRGE